MDRSLRKRLGSASQNSLFAAMVGSRKIDSESAGQCDIEREADFGERLTQHEKRNPAKAGTQGCSVPSLALVRRFLRECDMPDDVFMESMPTGTLSHCPSGSP